MLDEHYLFVDYIKSKEDLTWDSVAAKFNGAFGTAFSGDALRKKYKRELHKREDISGDILETALRIIRSLLSQQNWRRGCRWIWMD